ncbi:MAG: glycoside hydrolase family 10 protein, partial [Planctomycetota bacterium]
PKETQQASWNIQQAWPVEGKSRIAAVWHSKSGVSTNQAALIMSDNCAYLTHVLLGDDPANKFKLLLAMVGNLAPELWREAVQNSIDRIGQLGPYKSFHSAKSGITALAFDSGGALSALDKAVVGRDQAVTLVAQRKFSDAVFASEEARESMIDAYCLAQKPLAGEHRAFWCHSAFGVSGMSWDEAVKTLADNGFTAVLPNMLWGGVAFYQSDVLPTSKTVAAKGDQIKLCLAACKKYGVECHVWKVNFNMGWATEKEYMARMKAEGRTQVNYDLSPADRWLCPSHPANQKLEIDSMLEVARKYDVDGLHFDYIRYPGKDGCFCNGCKQRFEKSAGASVPRWPSDVRYSKRFKQKWLDFRRRQITTVVEAVARGAKRIRGDVEISAAVFRNWPSDRDAVGQDWKLWCDRGYLDFVCPMDYTAFNSAFERMVSQQLPWAGKVPCYPGIGLSVWPDQTDICKLIEQINITRRLGTGGFTIFNYGPAQASEVLPQLGKGMTKKAER